MYRMRTHTPKHSTSRSGTIRTMLREKEAKSFPKRQILDSSKLKEFEDDKFKFDENVRKFSKRVKNTMGKGEIARSEQFLILPQCFQKTLTTEM